MKKKNKRPPGLYERIYEDEARRRASEALSQAQREEAIEHTAANKRRRSAGRKAVAVALIFVLFVALTVFVYKLMFVIKSIEVKGCTAYPAETVCEKSGVSVGDNLYSFSYRVVGDRLRKNLPYIKSLDVDRLIPDKIVFNITEFTPEYYTFIYGDTYVLSADMTVLERIRGEEIKDLRRIDLGAIERAVCGEQIVFSTETELNHAVAVGEAVAASDLAGRITKVDMTSTYNITMDCDGKYRLILGTYNDCAIKLRLAAEVLKDEMFESPNRARIDLSDTSKTNVTVDNSLKFD